jgi:hypothetical protein
MKEPRVLKLLVADRRPWGYEIGVRWTALCVIVGILIAWGFAVHVADRLIFG